MTREDIIRVAREAGWSFMEAGMDAQRLERFAALVAAAAKAEENEACAQLCDSRCYDTTMLMSNPPQSAAAFGAAQAIRARKENT